MNRLQMATLLSWAGNTGLEGRKRLQKVVFCLQQAGCDLECGFTLHHFGPYSRDVAAACDEMVAAGLIEEHGGPAGGAMSYTYSLTPTTRSLLEKTTDAPLQPYQPLATSLIQADMWPLELGSTVLYYFGKSEDWDEALEKACEFKRVDDANPSSQDALTLAKHVRENAHGS